MFPASPVIPPGRPSPRGGLLVALFAALATLLLSPTPAHAAPAPAPVIVRAGFRIEAGRLQLERLPDGTTSNALVRLYQGNPRLADLYVRHVIEQVNDALAARNRLVEWLTAKTDSHEHLAVRKIIPADRLRDAGEFTGPLTNWLTSFAGPDGGQFFDWRPTRPPPPHGEDDKTIEEAELRHVLAGAAGSLIGQVNASEVPRKFQSQPVLELEFGPAQPVKRVKILDFDFSDASAQSTNELRTLAHHRAEKRRLERELERVTSPLGIAWNDDLAVQRMIGVLRNRGYWSGFGDAPEGNPRAVHWLTFSTNDLQPEVRLPHLCHLVFEPGARDDALVTRVTDELLRPAECEVVHRALRTIRGELPPDARLTNIFHGHRTNEARVLDLFALGSYLGFAAAKRTGVLYSPLPVREAWLNARLDRIRKLGWLVDASPTMTNQENRLIGSSNPSRRSFERGGLDITLSPARNPDASGSSGSSDQSDSSDSSKPSPPSPFQSWLRRLHARAELGISVQDTQPVAFLARGSVTDDALIGTLTAEVRYQYRFSGSFDWHPAPTNGTYLPSSAGAFTDSAARRKVDGREIEIEKQGVRLRKEWVLGTPDRQPRFDVGLQLARVRDLRDSAAPTANELSAPLGISFLSEPNPWDARESWSAGLRATPAFRDRAESELWVLTAASVQRYAALGSLFYHGRLDAQWALGSAPSDALPWVGGTDGVRGIRPYGVPAEARIIARNELWFDTPFVLGDSSSAQSWFRLVYGTIQPAIFVDTAWASGIHESTPTEPWFVSPGVGIRFRIGNQAHLSLDYAYGFSDPSDLGGSRFTLGLTTRFAP